MRVEPTRTNSQSYNGAKVITAQDYVDEEVVAEKLSSQNYTVHVVVVEYEGERLAVVYDGNHRLEASKRAGVSPVFVTDDWAQSDADCNDGYHRRPKGAMPEVLHTRIA